jgi:hypothetical protein
LLLTLLAVALSGSLVAAAATPKKQPSTIYVDKAMGYRITVPQTWQIVPPSVAGVKARIAQLKRQKKTQLATYYSDMIATAAGRNELESFRFRAFKWPALPGPVPTDVTVFIQPVPKTYKQADLPAIAASFANDLKSPGAKIDQPQTLKLPAGRAALITGTVPQPKPNQAFKTGFSLVLLLKPGKLYMLSFRIDSTVAAQANVFTSIAQLFRFV